MPRIRADSIEAHKALTRTQVLEAAEELFRAQGYEETSLGDIAAYVGIGRTTLYEYFKDKEDLMVSLVEERLPDVIHDMVSSLPAGLSHAERLCRLATRTVEFVATDPSLGIILHRDVPKLSGSGQVRVRAAHGPLATEFTRLYRAGVAEGELRALPVDVAGRFIQDLIMSAARVLITSKEPPRRMDEVTRALLDFLMNGLGVC